MPILIWLIYDISDDKVGCVTKECKKYCLERVQRNYEKYQLLGSRAKKKELLVKILVGNIISMLRRLGYNVPEPIKADIHDVKEVPAKLKCTPMLGFLGSFSVNFDIPDYWGIGKLVSRGFGTARMNVAVKEALLKEQR
jgi:hypothetical protein